MYIPSRLLLRSRKISPLLDRSFLSRRINKNGVVIDGGMYTFSEAEIGDLAVALDGPYHSLVSYW